MVSRQGALLLNALPIRIIINGSSIYELSKGRSIAIALPANYPHIVVTNGFHFSQPKQLRYDKDRIYHLTVHCLVDNDRLLAGSILTVLFFLAGLTSGIIFIRMLSFLPLLYFLYLYYIDRKSFIQIRLTPLAH